MARPKRRGGAPELALLLDTARDGRASLRRFTGGSWSEPKWERRANILRTVYALTSEQRTALDQLGLGLPGESSVAR